MSGEHTGELRAAADVENAGGQGGQESEPVAPRPESHADAGQRQVEHDGDIEGRSEGQGEKDQVEGVAEPELDVPQRGYPGENVRIPERQAAAPQFPETELPQADELVAEIAPDRTEHEPAAPSSAGPQRSRT